jgi:hypothetical protein
VQAADGLNARQTARMNNFKLHFTVVHTFIQATLPSQKKNKTCRKTAKR